ncbi:hypothetical protein FNYG_13305 [Fusarium nygamai]|uniref:Uncharacterized protein n=1 Tax=Gibberella nygamai TaxID=42673 RepID=A0A2K0VTR0_GIBNY|nr:hypothetical protein FNYG_13305 [Fusarium nygamai]
MPPKCAFTNFPGPGPFAKKPRPSETFIKHQFLMQVVIAA